jgi:hypothetical protein
VVLTTPQIREVENFPIELQPNHYSYAFGINYETMGDLLNGTNHDIMGSPNPLNQGGRKFPFQTAAKLLQLDFAINYELIRTYMCSIEWDHSRPQGVTPPPIAAVLKTPHRANSDPIRFDHSLKLGVKMMAVVQNSLSKGPYSG